MAELITDPDKVVEAINTLMQGPMAFYNSAKVEGELDLVALVRQRLMERGLVDKLHLGFDQNRFIMEAHNRPAHAQQYLLNRYFTTQFMAISEDTLLQRYALIYEVSTPNWIQIFENSVLPAFVEFGLPKPI